MSDYDAEDGEEAPPSRVGAYDSAAHVLDSARPRLRVVSDQDQFEDEWVDAEEPLEAILNGTHGRSIARFTPVSGGVKSFGLRGKTRGSHEPVQGIRRAKTHPGIKRRTPKQIKEDMPPTPRGCEWRRSDEGWNLWRYWSEPDEDGQRKIKKTRYTGHLSHDAWQIMKEYDHETFLSIVGQRLRRHGRG